MENLRKHGHPPYSVVVVHGGPGAGGEMAPVARELARGRGVLEPIQTAGSIEGQIDELKSALEHSAVLPVTLIGFSWGAWLSYMLAAADPSLAKKLILIGSGAFEKVRARSIDATRLQRLSASEQLEFEALVTVLAAVEAAEKDAAFARLGALCTKADAYDPIPHDPAGMDVRADIFERVWAEAVALRKSGRLLELGRTIECPVIAIHGEYDPHPSEGVRLPLSRIIPTFQFILLDRCGHKPWIERQARDEFYRILEEALQ